MSARRTRLSVSPTLAIALLCAALLVVAAGTLRSAEVDAEYDRYHEVAENLLRGRIVYDRFHPFGYPLLVAALVPVVGDSLVAGGIVSALAAGLLVWAIGCLAERLRPGAGPIAALFVAGNGIVWVYGTMAGSDMTATALLTAATAIVATAAPGVPRGRALLVGLLAGYAVGTRFAAAAALLALGVWIARRAGWRAAAAVGVGAVCGYAPNAVLLTLATGSPVHNDGWHVLYLKLVCDYDYGCLQRAYDTGGLPSLGAFLSAHGGDLVRSGWHDLVQALASVLPSMALGAMPPVGGLLVWPIVAACIGLLAAPGARRTGAALLALAVLHVLVTCLSYAPRPRFLLAALPFASLGLALLAMRMPKPWQRRLAVSLCIGLSLANGFRTYARFLAEQPAAEVAVMRRLPTLVARPMALLTTLPSASRYVAARISGYLVPSQPTPAATWRAVRQQMQAIGADVFCTGRISNQEVFRHLTSTSVPADFTVLWRDADTIALERRPAATDWIESFAVEPAAPRIGEAVVLRLRLAAAAVAGEVAGAGVAVRDANGEQSLFDLPPTAAGGFVRQFVVPAPPGEWQLTPFLLRVNGQVLRGAEAAMRVQ